MKSSFIAFLLSVFLFNTSLALPDDAGQEVFVDAISFGGNGNTGIATYRGSIDKPVVVTQGSLKITGLEVTIERVNDTLHKVTALGELAHFQQQPELDQAIIYGSGKEIVFDNTAQYLTMDIDAELIQGGTKLNSCHIDYDLTTENMSGTPCHEGDRIKMNILPDAE